MIVIEQRKCFKLQTFVYVTVLLLMVTYILLGVASLVWFVIIQDEEENEKNVEDSKEDRLKIPVILLGIILVMCLLGSK